MTKILVILANTAFNMLSMQRKDIGILSRHTDGHTKDSQYI